MHQTKPYQPYGNTVKPGSMKEIIELANKIRETAKDLPSDKYKEWDLTCITAMATDIITHAYTYGGMDWREAMAKSHSK